MTDVARVGFGALGNRPDEIVALGRHGEKVGFSRIWYGDHLAQPEEQKSKYPYAEIPLTLRTIDYIDPFVMAGAVAAATSRIEIATNVFLLPMHHPLIVSRAIGTIQTVADGRFVLGVGAGWMPEEFEALGIAFERRGRRMNESLQILRKAQAGGVFSHSGREFSFEPLTITHRAISVPLIVGGVSDAALRRAARYGDGWCSTPNWGFEEVLRGREQLEAFRKEFGTSDRPFTIYVRVPQPDPELMAPFQKEGFTEFNLGAAELFPRTEVAGMSIDDKCAVLDRVAADFGLRRSED